MSDAVWGGAFSGDQTQVAATVIGREIAVSRSGSGVVRQESGTHHLDSLSLAGGIGGQGAGRGELC